MAYYDIVEQARRRTRFAVLGLCSCLLIVVIIVFVGIRFWPGNGKSDQDAGNKVEGNLIQAQNSSQKALTGNLNNCAPPVPLPSRNVSDIMWVNAPGGPLPASRSAGPFKICGSGSEMALGYASSDLGGVMAAINIYERASYFYGPKVFAPTVLNQIVGTNKEAFLSVLNQTYLQKKSLTPNHTEEILRPIRQLDFVGYKVVDRTDNFLSLQILLKFSKEVKPAQAATSEANNYFEAALVAVHTDDTWYLMAPLNGTAWGIKKAELPTQFNFFPEG